jgi:endonuclease/exonuclease/phosphatase family metal-dependent hydrolase
MNLKHLQLNTSLLRDPQKVTDFIINNNIDVACIQEICYPIGGTSPLAGLLQNQKYNYIEGVHFYYHPNNQTLAVALASKYPIVDYQTWYFNTPDYWPKNITGSDQLFGDIINNNYPDFPASRGLVNEVKSRCVLAALIQTPAGLLRLISTHYTVSDLCVETSQMYQMSLLINSIVKHSFTLPTIFSADLNIRPQSYSVAKISEVLTCHTVNFTDTLGPNHRARKKDFPDGLATQHVFSTGLNHLETLQQIIDFSEHQALISNFEYVQKS